MGSQGPDHTRCAIESTEKVEAAVLDVTGIAPVIDPGPNVAHLLYYFFVSISPLFCSGFLIYCGFPIYYGSLALLRLSNLLRGLELFCSS